MLVEKLTNKNIEFLPQNILNGIKWIKDNYKKNLDDGKYEISDTDFAIIQTYDTSALSEGKYENHRTKIDIQFLISGTEWLFQAESKNLQEIEAYSKENDIEFFAPLPSMEESNKVVLKNENFVVLWPGDAHMPCITPESKTKGGEKNTVKKIVIKIRA